MLFLNIMMKFCNKCQRELNISEFHKHRRTKDGLRYICKKCAKEKMYDLYHNNHLYHQYYLKKAKEQKERELADPVLRERRRERYNKAQRTYRKTHRARIRFLERARYHLRKSGLQQVVWKRAEGKCESCGEKLYITKYKSNAAIHHLDNNPLHNVLDNLILLCTKCHLHKYHRIDD